MECFKERWKTQGQGQISFSGIPVGSGRRRDAAAWALSGAISFGGNSFEGSAERGCILTAKAPVLIFFPGNTGFLGNRKVQPPKF